MASAQLDDWLGSHDASPDCSVICLETCGVYQEAFCYDFVRRGYQLAAESPLKVKRAFPPASAKTDALDAKHIAQYAFRFYDQLSFWQPDDAVLEEVRSLLATGEQLVGQKTQHQNALSTLGRKVIKPRLAEKTHREMIVHVTGA